MTGAANALQAAAVARLKQFADLTGIYHDAPARATYPYAVLVCSDEKDWSCKGRPGSEISLQLVLWDELPARLLELEDQISMEADALSLGPDWQLSTLQMTGKRRLRNPLGAWNSIFDFRARLMAQQSGTGS